MGKYTYISRKVFTSQFSLFAPNVLLFFTYISSHTRNQQETAKTYTQKQEEKHIYVVEALLFRNI